ncbi:hypothetical protein F0562_011694 [Nyssa sinensis]|uniref:Uncharacterized protein n=1 Tax=Nyssa sinensis TaxID=561372 RepID=A0A5J4ZTL9_9ASTE|nr:hypothetical protein F0562_011694 [Nyssa sinensis]
MIWSWTLVRQWHSRDSSTKYIAGAGRRMSGYMIRRRWRSATGPTSGNSFLSCRIWGTEAIDPVLVRVTKCGSSTSPYFVFTESFAPRRIGVIRVNIANLPESNVKRAKLSASKKQRVKLPNYADEDGGKNMNSISEFLSHPSGVEAILNTRALQSFQSIDSNVYRCTLPRIRLLNFEVAPVLDLRVTPTTEDCTVEMLSCKFEGSEIVEHQNNHFSAFMRNNITWNTNDSEPFLDVDVKLNITLEIHTRPFTLLPVSAVEGPGNLMMQALVDRLVPLLVQQLLQDYGKWVREQTDYIP